MNRDAWVSLVVAGFCVAALGVSATTLDSTMTTEPDDVININYERLPIDPEDAESFKQEIQSNQVPEQPPSKAPPEADEPRDIEATPAGEQGAQFDGEGRGGDGSGGGGSGVGSGPGDESDDESSFDRLVGMLRASFGPLALLAATAGVAAIGYRHRRRLRALFAIRSDGGEAGPESEPVEASWPEADPDDEVGRAWLEMVRRLDVDRPRSRTPAECAEAAIAAGLDAEAVRTITRLFEEIHYGDEPATDERRERARRCAARLDGGGG